MTAAFGALLLMTLPGWAATVTPLGVGSYLEGLPPGVKGPPAAPRLGGDARAPVPTSDWWTALAWTNRPFPQFAHPLALLATTNGLRMGYPGVGLTASRLGVFGAGLGGAADLVVRPAEDGALLEPVVDGWSDWFVSARFTHRQGMMRASWGHGSPYVYVTTVDVEPRIECGMNPRVWSGGEGSSVIGLTVAGQHFGLFAPATAGWRLASPRQFDAGAGARYCSVALLPDDQPSTLARFARYAHAHVTDTRVAWAYDPATAVVTTTYTFSTVPREGAETGTLYALYPHQWRNMAERLPEQGYASVRGRMKLAEGLGFTTRMTFPGILPWLPDVDGVGASLTNREMADPAGAFRPVPADTYWDGKRLGRLATLAAVADAIGRRDLGDPMRARLRERLESWFTAADARGRVKTNGVFAREPRWGTLIGYPASYGSDDILNDHHFHYGYFLQAAAEVARRDPAWAAAQNWGGMIGLLIRDVANPRRDDPLFPFLRCFDPYAGHSWASGNATYGDGNNQESSSEAMNAWAGLVLLGEATGDRALRDLGAWLFTTELAGIEEYWFNVHGDNWPAGYSRPVVTMVWGAKGVDETWFSAEPEAIHAINWLPFTGASLYLGRDPDYAARNYRGLLEARRARSAARRETTAGTGDEPRWHQWPDLIWMYRALSAPDEALAAFERASAAAAWRGQRLNLEDGNSPAALAHWLRALARLGTVDRSVTADTPLYAVFSRNGQRTHVAYNAGSAARQVRFSDGTVIAVAAGAWGWR